MSSKSFFRLSWLSLAEKDEDDHSIDKGILINRNGIWIKDNDLIQNGDKKTKDRGNLNFKFRIII